MTVENLRTAIETNRPFRIQMADGREYEVPHRDFVAFTRKGTSLVLVTDDDRFQVLPLLTMTGITQHAHHES